MKKYQKPKIKKSAIKLNHFFSRFRFNNPDEIYLAMPCFPPGTKILTPGNQRREIQNMRRNDPVLSYDIKNSKVIEKKVLDLIIHPKHKDEYIIINEAIKTTPDHKFWVNRKKWTQAGKLKIGDKLLNYLGKNIRITSLKKNKDIHDVYNLSVQGKYHNYFVENILAHNRSPAGSGGY